VRYDDNIAEQRSGSGIGGRRWWGKIQVPLQEHIEEERGLERRPQLGLSSVNQALLQKKL
jgi:hypothetical protein